MSPRLIAPIAGLVACALAAVPLQAQSALADALARAGAYLDAYSRQIAGVVLEEKYLQQSQGRVVSAREMRSDLAVMSDPTNGWVEFRDVFEVDGKAVRDREDRVMALFAAPDANSLQQARRIVAEGARFNLAPLGVQFTRTINLPLAALGYLRTENQYRSQFRRDMADSLSGRRVTVVLFEEKAMPRLIGTNDNAPARGQFWIDQENGAVLRSELSFSTGRGATDTQVRIGVDYELDPGLQMWLPAMMEESYLFLSSTGTQVASVSGRALYSNVRKFRVLVDEGVPR